jgi:hypothetical protein
MMGLDVEDALLARPSARAQVLPIVLIAGILLLYVLGGLLGQLSGGVVTLGCVVFGGVLLGGVIKAMRSRGAPWQLRLDRLGVTVAGHETVAWNSIAEVRVSGLKPRWQFWFPLGFRVVAFVPQPGTTLPSLPMSSRRNGSRSRWLSRRRRRLYGSDLVIPPSVLSASTQELTAAVRRWSDVPVR